MKQIWPATNSNTVNTLAGNSERTQLLSGKSNWGSSDTHRSLFPLATKVLTLVVALNQAPGGDGITFLIRDDAVDTSASLTIGATETIGVWTGELSVAAMSLLNLKYTIGGSNINSGTIAYWCTTTELDSPNDGYCFIEAGSAGDPHNTDTEYMWIGPVSSDSWQSTETNRNAPWPLAGDIIRAGAYLPTAPGTGSSLEFTIMKDGVAQTSGPQPTVSDTDTTDDDSTGSITLAVGDLVSWRAVPTNTPTVSAAQLWVVFDPDDAGHFPLFGGSADGINGTEYNFAFLLGLGWTGTESAKNLVLSEDITSHLMAVYNKTTNGTKTITLRDDAADTAQEIAASTLNDYTDGDDVSLADESLVTIKGVRSGGQIWNQLRWGFDCSVDAVAAGSFPAWHRRKPTAIFAR